MRCSGITRGGARCRLGATHGSYCYQHSPETVEERRRNASRGGKAGGNGRPGRGEVTEAKGFVRGLVNKLIKGEVERDTATAAFMGLNVLARYIELERKIKEQDELEERLTELENAQPEGNAGGGYRAWHR